MRAGYDLRLYREFGENAGARPASTLIAATPRFTRQQDNSASAELGQDVATFLLGLPTGGIDRSQRHDR